MTRLFQLIGTMFVLSLLSFAQEQNIKKCKVPKSTGGKYTLSSESRPIGRSDEVIVDVIVKPGHFNTSFMNEFGKRIKATYCHENVILLSIFDSKTDIVGWNYDWVLSQGKDDRRRGTYLFDRKAAKDAVEFSTKKGNPINEVRIDFTVGEESH